MPRDNARVNMGIWQDDDWRALPPPAQHLYQTLWTHPALSYCGVVDWRPGRIAALSYGWTQEAVTTAADCLRARYFIVTDDTTEECLIRSWVRWDGLMKQPRLAVSYANAYAVVSSNLLRGVIIDELKKLRERHPDLAGLTKPQVVAMFDLPAISAKGSVFVDDPFRDGFPHGFPHGFGHGLTHGFTPGLGEPLPNVSGSVSVPPTPAPAPAPLLQLQKERPAQAAGTPTRRGSRLPTGWTPTGELIEQMRAECPTVNLEAEHRKFTDHYRAKTGRDAAKLDWPAAWRNWIRRAADMQPAPTNGRRGHHAKGDDPLDRMLADAIERDKKATP
jgi:hypothetical protein